MTRQPSLKHRLQVPLTADRRQWPRWRYAPRGLFLLNSLHSPLDVVDGSFEAVDALDVFPSVSITRNVGARWSARSDSRVVGMPTPRPRAVPPSTRFWPDQYRHGRPSRA